MKQAEDLFEIKSVTHVPDSLTFDWNDVGGTYRVYKEGELLQEGSETIFTDGDLTQGKMYSYTIERMIDGEVADMIRLQTSAFSEEKSAENPLQFNVMTTIVAKTQIALSWEKIPDIDEYEIYRNGAFVKTVKGQQYIDREFLLDETYTYSIRGKRPLEKSEDTMSETKSLLSRIYGLFNPETSGKEAAMEEFWVTKMIDKPENMLTPIAERPKREHVDWWQFRYTTFLREKWLRNPNLLSPNHWFEGDGRFFDPQGDSYRTRADISVNYAEEGSPMTFTRDVGESVAYSWLKFFRQADTASTDGIQLERMDHGENEAGFILKHAVGNPLTTAPQIDYEVHAVMQRDGTFDMTGFHDQAPHHEVYLAWGKRDSWVPIHQAESKGLAHMSRVIGFQHWRVSNFQ